MRIRICLVVLLTALGCLCAFTGAGGGARGSKTGGGNSLGVVRGVGSVVAVGGVVSGAVAHGPVTTVGDPGANRSVMAAESGCAPSGLDPSAGCTQNILAAINAAHGSEGLPAIVLPPGYSQLTLPQQLLVLFNFERVDRGLTVVPWLCQSCDSAASAAVSAGVDPYMGGVSNSCSNS
jgi:hypothetical protein